MFIRIVTSFTQEYPTSNHWKHSPDIRQLLWLSIAWAGCLIPYSFCSGHACKENNLPLLSLRWRGCCLGDRSGGHERVPIFLALTLFSAQLGNAWNGFNVLTHFGELSHFECIFTFIWWQLRFRLYAIPRKKNWYITGIHTPV